MNCSVCQSEFTPAKNDLIEECFDCWILVNEVVDAIKEVRPAEVFKNGMSGWKNETIEQHTNAIEAYVERFVETGDKTIIDHMICRLAFIKALDV